MTENSLPWGGQTTGDAGPYSDDNWSDVWRKWFQQNRTAQGVLRGALNELAVSGAVSPVAVASGRAIVDGKFYENDASLNVAVPTPAGSTRIDLIVLEKDWSAQTVRVARVEGVEGGGAPSLTQNDGVTWQIPLAEVSITTLAAITITDKRTWAASRIGIAQERIAVVQPFDFRNSITVTTGDDAARIPIPPDMDLFKLSYVRAKVKTAPSGGPVTIMFHNIDQAVDMLSTALTIDDGETSSETAATPAAIKSNGDEEVFDGDDVRIDVDNANDAVGLIVEAGFVPR